MTDQIISSQSGSGRWQVARQLSALIEPSPAILEPPRRRRARILSALLLIIILLAIVSILFTMMDVNPIPAPMKHNLLWIDLVATLGLLGSYGLSRTSYFGTAAIIAVLVVLLAVFAAVLANPGVGMVLPYITLGVLMGGLLLPPRTTTLVFAITVASLVALPLAIPGYPVSDLVVAGFFVLIVSAVVLLGTTLNSQDLEQIEAQSGALLEREASLREAVQKAQDANQELSSRVSELKFLSAEVSLLSKMSQMLQACQHDDEAKAVIGHFAPQLFPATIGAIYLINTSRNYVESIVAWGETCAPLSESIFGPNECWALRRGRAHLVQEQASSLACQHVETDGREAFPSLCVPLMAHGQTLGLLHLESEQASILLSERQQLLAESAAEDLSLALANLKLRETLRHQSIRDPLTGLFNRRYFDETFERELQRAVRNQSALSIIMIDIDFFKRFNDSLGHQAGDVLLHELGIFFKKHIRAADLACRFGGEEFVLLLPETSLGMGVELADGLREGVSELRVPFRGELLEPVTISMGVAAYPDHGMDVEALLTLADTALYRAKQGGRNCVMTARR